MRTLNLLLSRQGRLRSSKLIVLAILLSTFCFVLLPKRDVLVPLQSSGPVLLIQDEVTTQPEEEVRTTLNSIEEVGKNDTLLLPNEYTYPFIIPNMKRCLNTNGTRENVDLLLIVKSAVPNFKRRAVIRETWGREDRFPNVTIRRIFNLGWMTANSSFQDHVLEEHVQNGDIVQSAFVENYYNNTIKTMMGMRWTIENCPTTKIIMFVDDDMYVSVRNVLRFVSHPKDFPKSYVKVNDTDVRKLTVDYSELQVNYTDFYVGHTMVNFAPHRDPKSKWYISERDYPGNKYPTFVLAGSFLMSFPTLQKMYAASRRTKHLRFDDVYLGLVANNAGIAPIHNNRFSNWDLPKSYRFVISAHLYGNTDKMSTIWKKQLSLHNA